MTVDGSWEFYQYMQARLKQYMEGQQKNEFVSSEL